jgi:hypothetical protein
LHSEKPLKRLKAGVRPPHRAEAAVLIRELDDSDAFALMENELMVDCMRVKPFPAMGRRRPCVFDRRFMGRS